VRIALRMGIPVFVAPSVSGSTDLQWQAEQQADGIVLKATNPGNLHVRLMDFAVLDQARPVIEREPLVYLLAGQSRQWKIVNASGVAALQLKAQTDEGELALAVPVSKP
jgi:P pilus assembly chaperone PapD